MKMGKDGKKSKTLELPKPKKKGSGMEGRIGKAAGYGKKGK